MSILLQLFKALMPRRRARRSTMATSSDESTRGVSNWTDAAAASPDPKRMGDLLVGKRRMQEATASYQQAIELDPNDLSALVNLAVVYETMSRLEDAEAALKRVFAKMPSHPLALVTLAKLQRRRGDVKAAIGTIESAGPEMDLDVATEMSFELGRLYDQNDETDKAFEQFTRGNKLRRRMLGAANAAPFLYEVSTIAKFVATRDLRSFLPDTVLSSDRPPVFPIGFPRSGTTLLDIVLSSHSRIQGLEERPMVVAMMDYMNELPGGYPEALMTLDDADRTALQDTFYSVAEKEIGGARLRNGIVLDKNPLNIVRVPLILGAFPDARFILAIRHPCDVVLSCFMQYFSQNIALDSFLDLGTTVALYVKVMNLWRLMLERLPIRYHRIRYEDVVADLRREVGALLEFVGTQWEEGMERYYERAMLRRIDTPSYHQVTQPVYERSRYRRLRYRRHLQPFMRELEPFIEYFGY
jgi:tetratricopeptide (TPR) repeat protein